MKPSHPQKFLRHISPFLWERWPYRMKRAALAMFV